MGGIFGAVADGQSGMFRLQQAKKPWERAFESRDAKEQLAEKAEKAKQAGGFSLTPEQERDRAAALTAMEEAKRVGGPKAAAQQRLEEVERKIEELKLSMRYAHGDRQKLAQLAREAAVLAREAGRAAKEYGTGIANAAEMGLGGGAGLASTIEITHTRTVTTLTVQQTEMTLDLRISLGGGADAGTPAPSGDAAMALMADGAGFEAAGPDIQYDMGADIGADMGSEVGSEVGAGTSTDRSGLPPEIADLVKGALAGLQSGAMSGTGGVGNKARELMQRMLAENDLKMSRYKEADGFGRRVEAVLVTARNIIGEAKAANMLDEVEERRKARRDSFKEYDKIVDAAQEAVDDLRQAAFGSSITTEDILGALSDGGAEAPSDSVEPVAPAAEPSAGLVDLRA